MPEPPHPKPREHPFRLLSESRPAPTPPQRVPYAELETTSNFSFLHGASHPEELVQRAAELGHAAACIADTNTLAGVVRAHVAARELGVPLAVGSRLVFADPPGLEIVVYPTTRGAYARLCRLLTLGKRRSPKGQCTLSLHDFLEHQEGMLAVVVPPRVLDDDAVQLLRGLRRTLDDDRLSIAVSRTCAADDDTRLRQLRALAEHVHIPLAGTNAALYHAPARRPLQDVLTCIRLGCSVGEAGLRLEPNSERHLKPGAEVARLLAVCPGAAERSAALALRSATGFSLDELRYEYPDEVVPPGHTPMSHLVRCTWAGADRRYPGGVPGRVRTQVEHELRLIEELGYAPYFLTVHDLVAFARERAILCQGRGAAANSAVCFCLGVTAVDPDRINVLFERFLSRERNEPPDIDIDFEHERREEVIQYLYRRYGRDRAALTAEVISYRGRSAIREVGKAMGLSLDCVDRMARTLDWWERGVVRDDRLRELGLNPADTTLRHAIGLADQILGFPRHLSQHVGGFVITRTPLCELVPIENAGMPDRTIIEWDKDDIDAMGMLKVDVLGLGMLTCVRKGLELLPRARDVAPVPQPAPAGDDALPTSLADIPPEDPAVYDMLCHADSIGVFQVESRAQMSMLPRLRPRCFYDLVIEVAIVRPGPIQGNMVHPYLRRRSREEPVHFPDERVRDVLERTMGVPLFQEQAMALAIVAGGFTPGEADQLRRAMAAWKRKGDQIARFGRKLVAGMTERGYAREFAERCFEQIKGFSEYGFPESHAASFALIVYASAWLKRRHPAVFAAALLNSQPMGFYAPAQIVRDAREHAVEIRPIDVAHSDWDCTLEPPADTTSPPPAGDPTTWGRAGPALRLGLRLVRGFSETDARRLVDTVRRHGPLRTIAGLARRSGLRAPALRRLAQADAFASLGLSRQQALWQIRDLRDEPLPMFDHHAPDPSPPQPAPLPPIPPLRQVVADYAAAGLSLRAHPVSFLRAELDHRRAITAADLRDPARTPAGRTVSVGGMVLVRQRPGTAKGIVFMTIEDETGSANLILRPAVYQRFRRAARHSVITLAHGRVERQGEVVHVLVRRIESLDGHATQLPGMSRDFH